MRCGLLNERLTVYALQATTDDTGAKSVSLVSTGSYWCRVLHNRHDRADNDVERVVYNPAIRFELRNSVPVADNSIIEHNSLKYVIDNIERNHNLDTMTLYCSRYEQ